MIVGIAGVGLLGGSMGYILRKKGFAKKIIGIGRNAEKLQKAIEAGAIDTYILKPGVELKEVDILIVALPVNMIPKFVEDVVPYLKKGAIVTDVGSTKKFISDKIEAVLPDDIHFVGGHPMAGSEKSGIEALDPFLFENAVYVITAGKKATAESVAVIKSMAKVLDARVLEMNNDEHDLSVATISHLPHILASALVNCAYKIDKESTNVLSLAAGGFRDTTRIASGNPDVWRDITLTNSSKILDVILKFEEELERFKKEIRELSGENIYNLFDEAKKIKDCMPKKKKGIIGPMVEFVVFVPDKPGVIGDIAEILGKEQINIKDIEVLHVRENEGGSIRIGIDTGITSEKVSKILTENSFEFKIIE